MSKQIVFLFFLGLLVIFSFFQITITTLPLVLNSLIVFFIIKKQYWIFTLAILLGIFLDALLVRPLGESSLLFIFVLLLISFYERKFEIATLPFVVFSTFGASLLYLGIFGAKDIMIQVVVSICFSMFFFFLVRQFLQPAVKRDLL